jgi:hypothetical protein
MSDEISQAGADSLDLRQFLVDVHGTPPVEVGLMTYQIINLVSVPSRFVAPGINPVSVDQHWSVRPLRDHIFQCHYQRLHGW